MITNSNIYLLTLPSDILFQIIHKIKPLPLIKTSTTCKAWLALLQASDQIWEDASKKRFSYLGEKTTATWREHYIQNLAGYHATGIEHVNGRYFLAYGKTIFSFPELIHDSNMWDRNLVKTNHKAAINIFKSNLCVNNFKLLTTSADKVIKVWQSNNQKDFTLFASCEAHMGAIVSLGWVDSNNFFSGATQGELYYWKRQGNQYHPCSSTDKIHKATIRQLQFYRSARKKYLVSTDHSGYMAISKIEENGFSKVDGVNYSKPITSMVAVKINAINHIFTASKFETRINVWEVRMEKIYKAWDIIEAHRGGILEIRYDTSSQKLVSLGLDKRVKVWQKMDSMWKYHHTIELSHQALSIGRYDPRYYFDATYVCNKNRVMRQTDIHDKLTTATLEHPILQQHLESSEKKS